MRILLQDLQFAVRLFRKSPLFAVGVVLLLTLGIGVSSAVFSVVDAFQLRRLPVRNPEELVRLTTVDFKNFTLWKFPLELCKGVGTKTKSLTEVICQDEQHVALTDGSSSEHVRAGLVSFNYFTVLGVQAIHGRVFTALDENAGVVPAILTYSFWQSRYSGDGTVVGRKILLQRPSVRGPGNSTPRL